MLSRGTRAVSTYETSMFVRQGGRHVAPALGTQLMRIRISYASGLRIETNESSAYPFNCVCAFIGYVFPRGAADTGGRSVFNFFVCSIYYRADVVFDFRWSFCDYHLGFEVNFADRLFADG